MTEDEMRDSAEIHKINVNIYKYEKDKLIYDIEDQWFFDKNIPTFSALLYSTEDFFHVEYIRNAVELTKNYICPKYKSLIVQNHNGHCVKRMQARIDKYYGKFKKNYFVEKVSLPYCPHILDNPVYDCCLAYGFQLKTLQSSIPNIQLQRNRKEVNKL